MNKSVLLIEDVIVKLEDMATLPYIKPETFCMWCEALALVLREALEEIEDV